MIDNSPTILKLPNNEREYNFFLLVLASANTVLFDENGNPIVRIDKSQYNKLMSKFISNGKSSFAVELSLVEMLLLLSLVDAIANILLSDDADFFKSKVETNISNLDKDWDNVFFKNAQKLFANYKERFKQIPAIVKAIERISLR